MKLTIAQLDARIAALTEAAEHLLLEWTNDPEERNAGKWLSRKLNKEANLYAKVVFDERRKA